MEQVTQAEAMVCEACGAPLIDGGVDFYCDTEGCEDEHTLKNAVLASLRNEREATRTNDQAKDEEIARLFDAIAHGDDEHRAWLKEAIEAHFAGKPVPKPRGSGRKEAEIARLREALEDLLGSSTGTNNIGLPDAHDKARQTLGKAS